MTDLLMLAAAAAPTRLNPLRLFLDADIVVQLVMAGLVLASVWTRMIIVSFSLRMARVKRASAAYEREFWKSRDLEGFHADAGQDNIPSARVAGAGLGEWRRSSAGKSRDNEGTRQRLAGVMDTAVAQEADTLAERLNFLATVGSVAPFVGLFGTVWGIMNSFFQIGQAQNSSLAVVSPGI